MSVRAGSQNRTGVLGLEGEHNSHYTIPANYNLYCNFTLKFVLL